SFVTYKLTKRLRKVGKGSTESHIGQVEAVVKQDHNEARGQVYSELVAYRLATMVGVEAACGALVVHDTGLMYASLVVSNIVANARDISTKTDIVKAAKRYPIQCARIAVFDLWIGNDDRPGNLRADVRQSADDLIVALDHGRSLLGNGNDPYDALQWLARNDFPDTHPFAGLLDRRYCEDSLKRIVGLSEESITDACLLNDTCGAVMMPEQAALAELLNRRRAWLPELMVHALGCASSAATLPGKDGSGPSGGHSEAM
ncbi:MAG: hypothetical protein L0H29_04735, partial [Sinobacteraceae bacterium]|nr:hypothetical protein [Nevskiaceae bacterium]